MFSFRIIDAPKTEQQCRVFPVATQKYVKETEYRVGIFDFVTKCIVGSLCTFTRCFVSVSAELEIEVFNRSIVIRFTGICELVIQEIDLG